MRFLLTLLIALATPAGTPVQTDRSGPYPPLGRLVDIAGRKLHIHCSGQGTPTVILVAGSGAFAIDWALAARSFGKSVEGKPPLVNLVF